MLRMRKNSCRGSGFGFVLGGSLLILAVIIVFYWQSIFDQINLWSYQPTSAIVAIADRSDMSSQGRRLFYASRPELSTADDFNSQCERKEDSGAILGCYRLNRIYLYDIDNDQLDGIKEVTASHEMLHAAWLRLSSSEKDRLSSLLEEAYQKVVTSELTERMDYYDRNQPGERANELHSILGTEYSDLGSDLEAYYADYFNDRSIVVSLYNNYHQVFRDIKDKSKTLATQLDELAVEINTQTAQYNADVTVLSQDIADLNSRYNLVDQANPSAVAAYNRDRAELLARIDQLEAAREQISEQTSIYSSKLSEYNALAIQANELTKSIDSTLVTTPKLQ